MATPSHLLLLHVLSLLILSLSSLPIHSQSASLDSFVYGGCTQEKYTPDSPYEANINSLLTSLVNSATYSAYNNFTISAASPEDVIYGLYQCRGDLSMPDCATCVARAVSQVGGLCSQTSGGALQLQGCLVKYDNTTFLGVEDKTVVTKKCGPSIGDDSNEMTRRDAVLASLAGGGGAYRVGGSQDVQGMAQCVGDLSVAECQDCINDAIGQLKSECGSALEGEMFLGKCYSTYSTSGSHGYSSQKAHDDEHDDNDGEKTFAIVIGLLAGVALIIIFLTFMRRVLEGNGK